MFIQVKERKYVDSTLLHSSIQLSIFYSAQKWLVLTDASVWQLRNFLIWVPYQTLLSLTCVFPSATLIIITKLLCFSVVYLLSVFTAAVALLSDNQIPVYLFCCSCKVLCCLQDLWPRQSPVRVAAGQDWLQVHLQPEMYRGGLPDMAPTQPGNGTYITLSAEELASQAYLSLVISAMDSS